MSAEKCGSFHGVVLLSPTVLKEEIPASVAESSKQTSDMLKRVRARVPHFYPADDREVWIRARSLGLTEEE